MANIKTQRKTYKNVKYRSQGSNIKIQDRKSGRIVATVPRRDVVKVYPQRRRTTYYKRRSYTRKRRY